MTQRALTNNILLLLLAFICTFGNCAGYIFKTSALVSFYIAPLWFGLQIAAWLLLRHALGLPRENMGKELLIANAGMGFSLALLFLFSSASQNVSTLSYIAMMIAGMTGLLQLSTLFFWGASAFSILALPFSALSQARDLNKKPSTGKAALICLPFLIIVLLGFSGVFRQFLFITGTSNTLFTSAARISGNDDVCDKANHPWECYESLAKEQKRPDLCLKINGMVGADESCLEKYAAAATHPEDCTKMDALVQGYDENTGQDFRRLKARISCYAKFPDSAQIKSLCPQAWEKHDAIGFIGMNCVNAQNINARMPVTGDTPLLAYFRNPDSLLTTLQNILIYHPDMSATDKDGNTALHLLTNDPTLPMLLNAGANPNAVNVQGLTPPMAWAAKGNIFMVGINNLEILRQAGWNLNQTSPSGQTILHVIAASISFHSGVGNPYVFEQKTIAALIAAGADPKIRDKDGHTAADIANARGLNGLFPN